MEINTEHTALGGTIIVSSIGLIRNLDGLGRLVIPAEYRKQFGFYKNTPVEIVGTNEGLLVRKVPAKEL